MIERTFKAIPEGEIEESDNQSYLAGFGRAADFASGFCFRNHQQKVSPLRIAQEILEIAGEPEFDIGFGFLRE
ncbi:MAG: hypothetical protein IZT59_12600 [Verrucomicrobia bacterium]|nr:hypothetical protein [Verrucomicrobiota bacterium]